MSSRFDDEDAVLDSGSTDRRLGQGDAQWSTRLREKPHALVLDQQCQVLVDHQVAFGRAVLQPHKAVALEYVEPGECLDV